MSLGLQRLRINNRLDLDALLPGADEQRPPAGKGGQPLQPTSVRPTRYGAAERWRAIVARVATYRPEPEEIAYAIRKVPQFSEISPSALRTALRRAGWRATITFDTATAARALGVTTRQVQRLVQRGEISLRVRRPVELPDRLESASAGWKVWQRGDASQAGWIYKYGAADD